MVFEQQFSTKSMANAIQNLYMNDETADFYFIFEGDDEEHCVPAHKIILASGSPVFHAMFHGTLKEKTEVKIKDASVKGFKEFLQLFYLCEVNISDENYVEFLNLSNKYDMPEGLEICEKFLLENTDTIDLCKHLGLAIKFNLEELEKYCDTEICYDTALVFKTIGFIESTKEVLESILKLHDHSCLEMDVFNACIAWAENACKNNGTDATDKQNIRCALGDCFYYIPFAKMNIDTFSKVVFAHRTLFTLDEVADIMALITTGEITELSKKFTQNRDLIHIWDDYFPIETVRTCEPGGSTLISCNEYTSFTSNKKLLLCGFDLFDLKKTDVTSRSLSATISITKQNHIDEPQEKISEELQQKIQLVACAAKGKTVSVSIELNKPIVIVPQLKYNIHIDFSSNASTEDKLVYDWEYLGKPFTTNRVANDGVILHFYNHPKSEHTSDEFSIIPKMYFQRM